MTTAASVPERDMEKIAWTVLVGSFMACVLLFFGTPALGYWYLNTATDAHETNLTVLSGTAIVEMAGRDPSGERSTRMAPEGAVIRTDGNTRVRLTLFEGSTLIVFPDTQVGLVAMRSPKFPLSSQPNVLQVDLRSGRMRLNTLANGTARQAFVHTPHGEVIVEDGEHLIEVQEAQTEVVARNGRALVKARDTAVQINVRERAVIPVGGVPRGPLPAERDLIANGNFTAPLAEHWRVYNDQGGDGGAVDGVVEVVTDRGRRAVRFVRQASGGNHTDTGIEQTINRDVSDFETIRLRADVLVNYQSLSGGGYLSSEFPLMVRVKYVDVKGGQNFWVHGFFYQNDSRNPTVNGELVPQGLWYPYESLDLTDILNPRPSQILSIQIYGSGWDFDSMVADVGLIVE